MTDRCTVPWRALPLGHRPGLRASLLGRASLAAVLAGSAGAPRAIAGGTHLSLQQALASASAAASRVTGNAATMAAGRQAAIGIANLRTAARSIQQALAKQAAGAIAAGATGAANGVGVGGLNPAPGYNQSGPGAWVGVSSTAPITSTASNGGTLVTVNQTSAKAMLNWTSFNVGPKTRLVFNQSAGGAAASSWTVLNRIQGSTSPSEIFGAITAPGQVLILNPNGVLFGAGAQVNLHSLVAGAISISNGQFLTSGIYGSFGSSASPGVPGASSVIVQPGAIITTPAPTNASDGGGSVVLIADTVQNGGTIETPAGQTILAGGRFFTLRPGYSVPANTTVTPGKCGSESECSTTLGTEIDASGQGIATNTGYIAATTGDITLAGRSLTQSGIVYATTSVSRRGTIHLLSDTTDTKSSIVFTPGSLTYIAPDPNSLPANNSQRDDTPRTAYGDIGMANQAGLTDYPDRSRIEITTGGTVDFASNSLVLANGGQVAVSTEQNATNAAPQGHVFVASGAQIDVSGLNNIIEPMSANTFQVNIQGGPLADSPINRDAKLLFNSTITLDSRRVTYVAPSAVDPNARDYTAGGLLEVSGELSQIEQSISQWSAIGGNVTMRTGAVVAQPGSVVNIAGGTVVYQAGSIPQTYLIGPGGVLYNANIAPANLLYSGIYSGYTVDHVRWHTTDTYNTPLLNPAGLQQQAYIEGRDAGTLTLATPTSLFEGTINAGVQTGPQQTVTHATIVAGTDPVTINQNVAPQAGSLVFADIYVPNDTASPSYQTNVAVNASTPSNAVSLTATSSLDTFANTAVFGAHQLNGLGGLFIETGTIGTANANIGSIVVNAAVTLAPGGTLTLAAPSVTLNAAISARSGAVTLETINPILPTQLFPGKDRGTLTVTSFGSIDTRGIWTNLATDPIAASGYAFVNGGNVSLISTGALTLVGGSKIDASAGAVATSPTALTGGHGGNITLVADDPALLGVGSIQDKSSSPAAPATIAGTVRSLGVSAGGTFSLTAPSIAIGNDPAISNLQVALAPGFFESGFASYILNGFSVPTATAGATSAQGVVVQPGTSITVAEPILEATASALLSPTGTDPSVPLHPVLNPEFLLNPASSSFQRRPGASLTLDSYLPVSGTGGGITIGTGAAINVDTGQSVTLASPAQVTVNGTIKAPSGIISIQNDGIDTQANPVAASRISIWIGTTAVLDAAGRAITGLNSFGQTVGEVFAGGSILVGAPGNANDLSSTNWAAAYIFVRPGAKLDASGAAALLDLTAGTYETTQVEAGRPAPASLSKVASAGGTISLASDFGIYVDNYKQGVLQAGSGGAGAAAGELAIRLGDPGYSSAGTSSAWANWAYTPHQIIVSGTTDPTQLPAGLTPGDGSFVTTGANGQAAISQQQITDGGFGSVFLLALDQITFNGSVALKASQSITLADYTTSNTGTSASVSVTAPYVLLAGATQRDLGVSSTSPLLSYVNTAGGNSSDTNNGQPYSQKVPCISGLAVCYDASLTVSADLIDLQGNVAAGGAYAKFYRGAAAKSEPILNAYGFNTVNLVSSGDIRFVPDGNAGTKTQENNGMSLYSDLLVSEGDINLLASRIYPVTGVDATILAGFNYWYTKDALQNKLATSELYYGGAITIGRTTNAPQRTPFSVFGRIGFEAATIVQEGNVYAPLGQVAFGQLSGEFSVPASAAAPSGRTVTTGVLSITLGDGSTTSVSADGLVVPFGGTTDGTSYSFDAAPLTLFTASLGAVQIALPSIQLVSPLTTVTREATLDLAGGGTLTGGAGEIAVSSSGTTVLQSQGFISGRGGSTDTLVTPFLSFNANTLSVTQPTLAQDPIFAIVPSYDGAYAPVSSLETSNAGNGVSYYGSLPQVGEQITIGKSINGLAAGTYTLLPSYYALLPGAYRVQVSVPPQAGTPPPLSGTTFSLGNGTIETTGNLGSANTGVYSVTPSTIYLTNAATVRTYSQYDEENYANYGLANAAVFGNPRPFLPEDAGAILVTLGQVQLANGKYINGTGSGLDYGGAALLSPAPGGYSATLEIIPQNATKLDVLGTSDAPQAQGVGVSASAIDMVGAPVVLIGDSFQRPTDSISPPSNGGATAVTVDSGAKLEAGALFLLGSTAVTVDAGASLSTVGTTVSLPDSSNGVLFSSGTDSVLGLANANFLFPAGASGNTAINIGTCTAKGGCDGVTTTLLSGNFLGFIAGGKLSIGNDVVLGARDLELDSSTLVIGTSGNAIASAAGTTSSGATLTQALVDKLIAGDPAAGIPALQTLSLAASNSIDFLAGASLNTIDPLTGKSTLGELDITTPAFFGQNSVAGGPPADATITTGTLVWNGIASTAKPPTPPGGFGDGTGTLTIDAQEIVIGYPAASQSQNTTSLGHTISGFGTVMFNATSEFSANNHASLSIYQCVAAVCPSSNGSSSTVSSGGTLDINSPVVTTAAGAVLGIAAGGDITLLTTTNSSSAASSLGGELDLAATNITIDTRLALQSGAFTANASNALALGTAAVLDLSGPTVTIINQKRGSFGGNAELISQTGNITEAAGALIDIAANDANAGTLTAIARQGSISLLGSLAAGAPSGFDGGSVAVTETSLGGDSAFQSLTSRLTAGGGTYAQSFEQTGAGNLTIGNITAQHVSVSVDGGNLAVTGTIDASSFKPGSIDLAATGNMTLASTAVLNVQETRPHTDQLGQLIAAENRSHIELQVASNTGVTAGLGTLTIDSGAAFLMGGPNGLALGDLQLDAPRAANNQGLNISAGGSIAVSGAATIAVNAFKTYVAGTSTINGTVVAEGGTITQSVLDLIDTQSQAFMNAAVANGTLTSGLSADLAGLAAYTGLFHLRPGVELDSGSSGSLTTFQSLDLAGYRYASVNPQVAQPSASVYGAGEPGVLWLRAQDGLIVNGNITDGFQAPPPVTILGLTYTQLWSLAPMLSAGDLSWSLRLVAGANIGAADSRDTIIQQIAGSAAAGGNGNLTLQAHSVITDGFTYYGAFTSVLRTGTGYLDLYTGGNFTENGAYGVYTAGTEVATAPNAPGEFFTNGGGDVTLVTGGNAQGYVVASFYNGINSGFSNNTSNWLRHSASAWWLDFGRLGGPILYAFNGLGALGGGNVDVSVGGNAGNLLNLSNNALLPPSTALDITVASSGYTTNGSTTVFGGGDIRLAVNGSLNPAGTIVSGLGAGDQLWGNLTDLRGNLSVEAGSIGHVNLLYATAAADQRPPNPFVSETFNAGAGPTIIIGDGQASLQTRGDLVLGGVGNGGGLAFSFYQPDTAVNLFAAGGNLVPSTIFDSYLSTLWTNGHSPSLTVFYYYPATFDAVAASQNIYMMGAISEYNIELAPSPTGSLNMLAANSIYDTQPGEAAGLTQLSVEMSGAATVAPSELPGLLFPVQVGKPIANTQQNIVAETASGLLHQNDPQPARFYAGSGDIVGLETGKIESEMLNQVSYEAYYGATAVQIIAGNDIVDTGGATGLQGGALQASGNGADFFLNNSPTDISLAQAGKDIIYANIDVAGPGQLMVSAGGNVYQGDRGILLSLGEIGKALTPLTRESGAGITVLAGLNGGFDPTGFANLYLNPANLANATTPLQTQKGKVERTYQTELDAWLAARGYTGTAADALAYFLTLPVFEQTAFLLTVYYAELSQSGLDYNNASSRFYHSYIEGKEAIAALFPKTDLTGTSAPAGGSLTLFSGRTNINGSVELFDSAIRTAFGGAITTVVPYGQTLLGNYGIVPQATAGILTQGSGDIDMYSYGSVTLGQSRVLTTYGGNVLIWMSSDGEINAGRGSKTTALTPPPNISYDAYGNIFLSPTVPASGAGIGALAPIAGIPAGNVNLIAPSGTIDAGEAGVRASGNINVAALTVVNGANLSSSGKTSGVPIAAGPSVAATSAASAAAGSSQSASQDALKQRVVQQQPSVIEVEVLATSAASDADETRKKKQPRA
jgi:filamentous hemagglutinin family protein